MRASIYFIGTKYHTSSACMHLLLSLLTQCEIAHK